MSDESIKKVINRYKLLSTMWLFIFLLFAVSVNWFLVDSNIAGHSDSGLDYYSSNNGFIWAAIIIGLNVVLHLTFFSLEKIFIFLRQEISSSI